MGRADASTRSRTSGRTSPGRLKTFEAVPCDTPAAFATSASFTIRFIPWKIEEVLNRFNPGLTARRIRCKQGSHLNRFKGTDSTWEVPVMNAMVLASALIKAKSDAPRLDQR